MTTAALRLVPATLYCYLDPFGLALRLQSRPLPPALCQPPVPSRPVNAELSSLVGLFYGLPDGLGHFEKSLPEEVPGPYRKLLDHCHHMTVAMEEFYEGPVDVRVLGKKLDGNHYARRILLMRHSDRRVVQFGIVRLNFDFLSDEVRREIEIQQTPLGRILIRHNVMRKIELIGLWRVQPGIDLCQMFGIAPQQTTYGRTAIIHCNCEPAVELLEIAAPVDV